jgi:hypothetical protein
MKKVLLLLMLSIIPMMAFSQTYKMYCSAKFNAMGKSCYILNFGDFSKRIYEFNGEKIEDQNDIQLINLMSRKGWKLEPNSIWYSDKGKYYVYIFSKEDTNEEEVKKEFDINKEKKK